MDQVKVAAVKLEEDAHANEKWLYRLLPFVSEEKEAKAKRYRYVEDGLRSVAGEVLVRRMLCPDGESLKRSRPFYTNACGKPMLEGRPDACFNLSHSGSWVAAAFGSEPLGIDVETVREPDLVLAKRFFSSPEYEGLCRLEPSKQRDRFYELWTLKESYIKAIGEGLSISLRSFSIFYNEAEEPVLDAKAEGGYQLTRLVLDSGYKLSVCSKQQCGETVQLVTLSELWEGKLCLY
ncbi:4'-phosphopantetheinyl transferase family protein [Paenibacillus sp. GCM10027627]|uniref:4'-phosphopantetheinyl transferase family protein n=1 Tax=unclassified Paenibacillus TaxID=185978 RepID=UPI003638A5FF